MTAPAARLRALLTEAANTAQPDLAPDVVAAIVDAQMRVFADVTVQRRKTVDAAGRLVPEQRLVAMATFETAPAGAGRGPLLDGVPPDEETP